MNEGSVVEFATRIRWIEAGQCKRPLKEREPARGILVAQSNPADIILTVASFKAGMTNDSHKRPTGT